jgi:hypothetical protein
VRPFIALVNERIRISLYFLGGIGAAMQTRGAAVKKIALSGIKPTGTLHIGNYLGMIKPAFELIEKFQTFYFESAG